MKENYKQLQEQYSALQEINKQLKEQYSALLVEVDELKSEQMCTSPVLFSPPPLPPPIRTPARTNPFQPSNSPPIPTNTQHPHHPTLLSLDETNLYELSNPPVHPFQPFNPSPTPETQHPYISTLLNIDYSPSFLVKTLAISCSRGNFAANLNREWFTVSERKTCNIRWKEEAITTTC